MAVLENIYRGLWEEWSYLRTSIEGCERHDRTLEH
jgi:hypothetical protein